MNGFIQLVAASLGDCPGIDIFQLVPHNDGAMTARSIPWLEQRIQSIKRDIAALGDLRPGAMSMQYNICGNPSCRCKADPPIKHGPYPQVSFTWRGKSTTMSVRASEVEEVQQQLDTYRRLRHLVDEWIDLALELSRLRLRERRQADESTRIRPKNAKSQQKAAPRRRK